MVHSMCYSKRKFPKIIIKIDIEKAFNSIKWDTIYLAMSALNFLKKLFDWTRYVWNLLFVA